MNYFFSILFYSILFTPILVYFSMLFQVVERSAGDDDDDDWENWGKEPRAQKAPGWALKALDEEEKEPSVKQRTCTQRQRGLRPVSLWCPCLAWILCVFLSICCLVTSAALGNR